MTVSDHLRRQGVQMRRQSLDTQQLDVAPRSTSRAGQWPRSAGDATSTGQLSGGRFGLEEFGCETSRGENGRSDVELVSGPMACSCIGRASTTRASAKSLSPTAALAARPHRLAGGAVARRHHPAGHLRAHRAQGRRWRPGGVGRQGTGGDGARVPSPQAGPAGTARTDRAADRPVTAGRPAHSEAGTAPAERPCQPNVGSGSRTLEGGRFSLSLQHLILCSWCWQ